MLRMDALVERAHVLIHRHCVDRAEELIAAIKGMINPETQAPRSVSGTDSAQQGEQGEK